MNAIALFLALTLTQSIDTAERAGSDGVLLVRVRGKIVFERAWGSASCDGKTPLTSAHLFDIGSITKVMTAAAVVETMPLNLRVGDVFPAAPPDKASLTVEQLLKHQSGLPDSIGLDETLIKRSFFLEKLWSRPLEKPQYSNAAYSLLAAMLEERSGKPYESHIRPPIAYRRNGPHACGTLRGLPWGSTADYFGPDGRPSWHLLGNGALIASVHELDRWFADLWAGKSISAKSTAYMREKMTRRDKSGRTILFASGANTIFSSHWEWWPEEDVTWILLTSDSEWPKEKLIPILRPAIIELTAQP